MAAKKAACHEYWSLYHLAVCRWTVNISPTSTKGCCFALLIVMMCPLFGWVLQGKFYLIIEELSQLFRSLVPIQLWYKYIMGDDPSSSYFLGGILIILYSLCKVSTTSLITSMGAVARAEREAQLKGANVPLDCC